MTTIHIASGPNTETTSFPQLFAGESPAVATRDILVAAAQPAIPQYTPLSWDAVTGTYVPWVPGQEISAVNAYAVPDLAVDQRVAVYVAGCFNIDAIRWPASTSEAQVELAVNAAGANSMLHFRKLLWSERRIAQGGLGVGPGFTVPPETLDT
ncbi:MAG: hypothetical protein DDT26_00287 [Dehalococcoidia bacterium]|nr:hypothetical protein [Chloroflexota bacterium]